MSRQFKKYFESNVAETFQVLIFQYRMYRNIIEGYASIIILAVETLSTFMQNRVWVSLVFNANKIGTFEVYSFDLEAIKKL